MRYRGGAGVAAVCWAVALVLSAACGARTAPARPSADAGSPPPQPFDAGHEDAPPAREQCNGEDDDGDGEVDETCACVHATRRGCEPEPPTDDVELCEEGRQWCARGGWGECVGAVFCAPVEDRFVYSDAVDLVLAVDQSPSMNRHVDRVRANVHRFAELMASSSRPYAMILVGSSEGDNVLCIPPPLGGPGCTESERFHRIDRRVGSWNALGIVRDELPAIDELAEPHSQRVIVVVSDDNARFHPPAEFQEWLRSQPGWADYALHAVIGTSDSSCDIADVGAVYWWLAAWSEGHALDICEPDWSDGFEHIAEDTLRRPRAYPLSAVPHGDVRVLGGAPPEALSSDTWRYDPDRRAVIIDTDGAIEPGEPLIVRYRTVVE